MKALIPRRLYTVFFFLGWFCLFTQFVWADGGRSNPYIARVKIIQTDRQCSGGGIERSTLVKVMLKSVNGSLKDQIIHMEMRDIDGVVYDFDHNDFYSAESGDFYLKEFPFFLADENVEIIVRDNEAGEYFFFTKQPQASIETAATYDGSWSGKTDQGYDVSFTVSDGKVTYFNIKYRIDGSYCDATVEQSLYESRSISGGSWSYSGSSSGEFGSSYTYRGTFASNTVCNGTWDYESNYCSGSGNGTWTANNGASPPTTTTTTTSTTTTSTSTTTTTTLPSVPTEPTLTATTSGTKVSLSWTSVAGAAGYTLYYAPYPYTGPDSIGNIPMGSQTSMSASLWNGASFYVAVQAYNGFGNSGYSNIEYFVINTSVTPPTVTTGPATSATGRSATLNGTVNPNGSSTTYFFQYGTSTSYGSTTSSINAGSGNSDVSAALSIRGLSSNTTYHYRLVATNSGDTGYGSNETFNTGGSFTVVSSFDSPDVGPQGLTYDGTYLWNSDDTLYKLNTSGSIVGSIDSPCSTLFGPWGLAFDGTYLWSVCGKRFYILDTSGNIMDFFDSPGTGPTGITFDGTYLWNADQNEDKIYKLDTSGNIIESFDSPGSSPQGLAFDGTYLWSVDNGEGFDVYPRIYKLDISGNVVDSFEPPDGPYSCPRGITFDGTYLWSADICEDKIYKIAIE